MAYFIQPAQGATGNKSAMATKNEVWVAQQIAIKPGANHGQSARNAVILADMTPMSELQPADVPNEEVKLVAYPNPVVSKVFIQFPEQSKKPEPSAVFIYDTQGRSYPVNAVWHDDRSRLSIDFSEMQIGLFIIHVSTNQSVQTLKVIKQ